LSTGKRVQPGPLFFLEPFASPRVN